MAQELDVAPSVRTRAHIHNEQDLYILVSEDTCFAKFAYENRPENKELRDIITSVCESVTKGLQRLQEKKAALCPTKVTK